MRISLREKSYEILVTKYIPGTPTFVHRFAGAGMGDCIPPEPATFEYQILLDGQRQYDLENDLTEEESQHIYEEFLYTLERE